FELKAELRDHARCACRYTDATRPENVRTHRAVRTHIAASSMCKISPALIKTARSARSPGPLATLYPSDSALARAYGTRELTIIATKPAIRRRGAWYRHPKDAIAASTAPSPMRSDTESRNPPHAVTRPVTRASAPSNTSRNHAGIITIPP